MPPKRQRNLLRDLAMKRALKLKQISSTQVNYDRLFQLSPDVGLLTKSENCVKLSA
jgi:hypothetical protein